MSTRFRLFFSPAKWVIAGCLLLLGNGLSFGQKTDQVILYRGDIITGEIRGLSRGRLDYKTDDMKTVSIEWSKIARVKSKDRFEVQLSNDKTYIGRIENGDEDGKLVIVGADQQTYVQMVNVVAITRIGASFLSRTSGRLSLGLDITRANSQVIWNTGARVAYRDRKWNTTVDGSSYLNTQSQTETTTRTALTATFQRFIVNSPWSGVTQLKYEQNDELQLDYRYTVLLLGSNSFIRTNRMRFQGFLGLAGSNELFVSEAEASSNLEAAGGMSFQFFQFRDPKVDLNTDGVLYAGLSDWGRIRSDFKVQLTWEVLSDFDVGIEGYLTVDTRPPEGATKLDYRISTTLGYSWD